jgi:hypothetical protein
MTRSAFAALAAILVATCAGDPPIPGSTAHSLPDLIQQIVKADYEADRRALDRLYREADAFLGDPAVESRVRYWNGFAKWRRAINGANEPIAPNDLAADAEIAAGEMRHAGELDPAFLDARIGEMQCVRADREAWWAASVRGTVIVAGRSTRPLEGALGASQMSEQLVTVASATRSSFNLGRAVLGAGVGAAFGVFAVITGESPWWLLAVPLGLLCGIPPGSNAASGTRSERSRAWYGDGGSDNSSGAGCDGSGGGGDGG